MTLFQNEDVKQFLIPEDDDSAYVDVDQYSNQWMDNMLKDQEWCDEAFIRLASKFIKRDIIVYTIPKENGHNNEGQIIYSPDESFGKIYLLNYVNTHFQSILPLPKEQETKESGQHEIDVEFSRSSAGKRFGFDKRY